MTITVFARKGGRAITRMLREAGHDAKRVRRIKDIPEDATTVMCWGYPIPAHQRREGVRYLNAQGVGTKLDELITLTQQGVPTLELGVPNRSMLYDDWADDEEWVPRRFTHARGNDIVNPPYFADYYTKKEEFVNEIRIHSFDGRSIRAAWRVPARDDHHPWCRSKQCGWKFSYGRADSPVRQAHRDAAHAAVKALGLDFGAVDVGIRADGSPVVIEVNRAPGLGNGQTGPRYVRHIERVVGHD